MAGSQYAYVRNFELPDPVLPNTYMIVRIDGKGFHKFSEQHNFAKPNDGRALELMNAAARHVVESLRPDITLAFGESDEYSFLLQRQCSLYKRRQSKLVTHIVSLFSSAYVFHWSSHLPDIPLQVPPSFDGRLVAYPGEKEVRDYFAWRQADTHINNLYNTTFWALVLQGEKSEQEAHKILEGTVSSQKHDVLFEQYGINYNKLPALFRKGTTLAWDELPLEDDNCTGNITRRGNKDGKLRLRTLHVDVISSAFWKECREEKDCTKARPSSLATAGEMIEETARHVEPWLRPERLIKAEGLGYRALR